MTPLHDLGLDFTRHSTSISPEGLTAHYGGRSPWGVADRSGSDVFRDSTDHARCPTIVRAWHAYHLSKGWFGLAYTSAVCPHGHRFEGRGPGHRTGAQGTNDGNRRSYATVYVAGQGDPLTDEAKIALLDEEIRLGVDFEWVHSDWKPTACPGDKVRAWKAEGWQPPTGTEAPPTPPPAPPVPIEGSRAAVTVSLPTLSEGSQGQHVASAQALMNIKGSRNLDLDGLFGPATKVAVVDWQRFFGLTVDGIIGPRTWATLVGLP